MNKKVISGLVAVIIFTMLSSLSLSILASSIDDSAIFTGFPRTKKELDNYVSPVSLKIRELQDRGLTEEEIMVELEKLGMGWNPKTGDKWVGRLATPEELEVLEIRYSSSRTLYDRKSVMRTWSDDWEGVATEMVSGSMNRAEDETETHYLCTQFGDLSNQDDWIEIVLMHNLDDPYEWWTWDHNDTYPNSQAIYHGDKNTSITAQDTLCIMVDGSNYYHCWINYVDVREGYLYTDDGYVGHQKEVYSYTNDYTDDDSSSVFWRNWLYDDSGWEDWDDWITGDTWFQEDDPLQKDESIWQGYWYFPTWVEN